MNFSFSQLKWRLFVLLLAFQALAVIETERASVADAAPYRGSVYQYNYRRPYGYKGRPYVRPSGTNKRPLGPDEEYQYGTDEIPYIFYS
uniref:Uncharacterized protein n=1 Tax=Daphnia galeata TaxID=27404 RepID=A0A8J2RDX3_9CRUS|nr:unnamed protein product [Daphnia galeata]